MGIKTQHVCVCVCPCVCLLYPHFVVHQVQDSLVGDSLQWQTEQPIRESLHQLHHRTTWIQLHRWRGTDRCYLQESVQSGCRAAADQSDRSCSTKQLWSSNPWSHCGLVKLWCSLENQPAFPPGFSGTWSTESPTTCRTFEQRSLSAEFTAGKRVCRRRVA